MSDDVKVTKFSVGYESAGKGHMPQHCGNCSMFTPNNYSEQGFGRCSLVEGSIHRMAWCQKWEG